MSGASTFISVPFLGIVFSDPGDDVVWFLWCEGREDGRVERNGKGVWGKAKVSMAPLQEVVDYIS